MLYTLISIVVGFASSVISSIIGQYSKQQQRKHEISMLKLRQQGIVSSDKFVASVLKSRAKESLLVVSVRPVVTYIFILFIIVVKICIFVEYFKSNMSLVAMVNRVLDTKTTCICFSIITYWFSNRTIEKTV